MAVIRQEGREASLVHARPYRRGFQWGVGGYASDVLDCLCLMWLPLSRMNRADLSPDTLEDSAGAQRFPKNPRLSLMKLCRLARFYEGNCVRMAKPTGAGGLSRRLISYFRG